MYSYYLALCFLTSALCVDIEITGDLAFDVKIRNYSAVGARQRAVDVDIPLRFSILNSNDDKEKRLPLRDQETSWLPRVIDDGGGNATNNSLRPNSDVINSTDTSLEASNKLRDDQAVSDDSREGAEGAGGQQTTKSKRKRRKKKKPSSTPPADCPYRYPEPWEANAVLSNMMNKLTKVQCQAKLFVMMARSLYEPRRPRTRAEAAKLRRFKVISARNHDAFDQIFHNMSTEYKLNYNASRERTLRSHDAGGGECASQAAVGRAWRRLLEQAQDTYRAAALRCMDLHLGPWLASQDGSMRTHLNSALSSVNKQLLKDVERIRSEQLRVLCRIYQLC